MSRRVEPPVFVETVVSRALSCVLADPATEPFCLVQQHRDTARAHQKLLQRRGKLTIVEQGAGRAVPHRLKTADGISMERRWQLHNGVREGALGTLG